MTNATNIMSTAPIQSTSLTRTTSQGAQPKYKPSTRAGKKNFSSTLDMINAKLDEIKQNVKGLQENNSETAQIEGDAEKIEATDNKSAQGKSETPQDAQKAISNEEESEIRNDSELIVEDEFQPADIFLGANEIPAKKTVATDKIVDAPKISVENSSNEKTSAAIDEQEKIIDEQSATNILAANSMAYLFGMNSESLLKSVESVREIPSVQNLQTLLPQTENNSQSMLEMLGGKSLRVFDNQPVEVEKIQTSQPIIQNQSVEVEKIQPSQPMIQNQSVEVEKIQPSQPMIQTPPVEVEQIQPSQPMVQTPPVEVEQIQPSQPTIQTQPVEVEKIQPSQPMVQTPPVEVEKIQSSQPTVQTQPVEAEQIQPSQPTVQTQPVEAEQIQPSQPIIQTQPVEVEQIQPSQPTIQTQPVETEQIQPSQPTIQTQNVETEPVQPSQPIIQAQSVEGEQIQPSQPTIQTQPVEVQPVQPSQPTIQTQFVETEQIQPSQPTIQTQNVEVEPIQPSQPTIQSQSVEVEQIQSSQPTIQTQSVEVEQIQPSQPTIQAQFVEAEPIQSSQPTIQSQPVEIQAAQPIIQQKIDERPALQNFSELLGVNIQVEEAPTAAPVTPPQSTPQQFNQNSQQQGEQSFQNQIFQPIIGEEAPTQPILTGGEIFATNLTASNDSPQIQPSTPTQAPDAPQMPQQDFDIPAQIVRQARLIRAAENTEMVIKLNPEHLGELTLRVSVSSSGAVNASFHSDNAQVRTIIENSLVQLRNDLNNAGLKVENVQVYAGLSDGGGLMNGQGGQAWQQNRRQSQRRINFDTIEREIDANAPVNENSSADGVDYSV